MGLSLSGLRDTIWAVNGIIHPQGKLFLLLGDTVVLALVTIYGFASHELLSSAGLRMLTTFLPLLIAWILVAPHLQAFDMERAGQTRHLWRPFWAMVLAAPLAAWLRGLWLGTPIIPVFVAVVGGISALALLVWRGLYLVLRRRTG
jgi:hypothetical protein